MIVYLGADHNGYELREELLRYLKSAGYEVHDDGNERLNPEDDYPIFAARVVNDLLASNDPDARGILLCGSGQGIMIAANRYKGIRACLGYDLESVRTARNDDDCNVLALPAKILKSDEANTLVEAFLNTRFGDAPRYTRRIKELDQLT